MENSALSHKQKDDFRKNSVNFGYLFARGYMSFGRATTYILTKALLAMVATLVLTDLFLSSFANTFNQTLVQLFSYWDMPTVAIYLDGYASPGVVLSSIPAMIIFLYHFCGFLIGMEKDIARDNLNQFR